MTDHTVQMVILIAEAVGGLVLLLLLIRAVRRRGLRGHIGPAAIGSVYELLNEDKRNAIEIIVEQRAEETDPETADGNLPDLEKPRRSGR